MPIVLIRWLCPTLFTFCLFIAAVGQSSNADDAELRAFAEQLLTASPDARKALLATERKRVTAVLITTLQRRGDGLLGGSDPVKAREAYTVSEEVARLLNDATGMTLAWNKIGHTYAIQGRYDEALKFFQQAITGFRAANDTLSLARALNNSGIIHAEQGRAEDALAVYQESLRLFQSLGNKPGIAAVLNGLGKIHAYQGRYPEALAAYRQCLQSHQELSNPSGVALAHSNIGNIYSYQGNYREALTAYLQSLKLREELGDQAGAAETTGNIGVLYEQQGQLAQALASYQKGLQLSQNAGATHSALAARINLASVYEKQGLYEQALQELTVSLQLSETMNSPADIAICLNALGNIQLALKRYEQAQQAFEKSIVLREKLNDPAGLARTRLNLGAGYYQRNRPEQALEQFQQALSLARNLDVPDIMFRAELSLGRAYQRLGRNEEAAIAFARAIEIIEKLRRNVVGSETSSQSFFEDKAQAYLEMCGLFVAQGKIATAFEFVERAKARALLDTLQTQRENIAKAMTATEQEQEDQLRAQLIALNTQYLNFTQRGTRESEQLKVLDAQRTKAQLALSEFQTRLYASHPELKIQRGELSPLSLSEAQALLPNDKTALLEFAVTDDKTLLFVLTKAATSNAPAVQVFSVPIKAKDLAIRARQFRETLGNDKIDLGYRAEAKAIYDLLLKPAQMLLQGKTALVFVPDGALWELPFQALVTPTNRFLIEDANVSYAPSLTALREIKKKRTVRGSVPTTLLAMGNPSLGAEPLALAQRSARGGPLRPLIAAENEVRSLSLLYGAKQSKIYIGAEALEERFKAEAGNYAVLHLATHGLLNDRSPMYSQILLSQAGRNEKEDGLLEAWELMNLNLKADLVVLSACDTARGRVSAGEGTIGLSWALFVAGVPTTVVSQWPVLDTSTQQLMVEFHRQLKLAPTKAEALRQAMLKVMRQPQTSHPFYWAPFVLIGAGQ